MMQDSFYDVATVPEKLNLQKLLGEDFFRSNDLKDSGYCN